MSQVSIINNRVFPSYTVVQSLTADGGVIITPDIFNNINIVGGTNIDSVGNVLTNTIAINLKPSITLTSVTATRLYTDDVASHLWMEVASIIADGTDANIDIQIIPKGTGNTILASGTLKVDSLTNGVVLSNSTGVFSSQAPLAAGTALMSNGPLLAPSFQTIAPGGVGSVVSNASGILSSITPGIAGTILRSTGVGNIPSWSSVVFPMSIAVGDLLYGSAIDTIIPLAFVNTATRYLANTGTGATLPEWSQVNMANGVTGVLTVPNGGTGQNTLTIHGVLIGNTVAGINATTAGTANQLLMSGGAAADPTWTSAIYPDSVAIGDVLVATAANTVSIAAGATTAGYVLMANGVATSPTFQALPPSFTWTVINADQAGAVDNGYICNKAGLLTVTLPAVFAAGKTMRITGINTAVGWRIAQQAGQRIYFGASATTLGAGGYLEATAIRDSVEIVCVVANTDFNVISSVGNITVA